MHYKKILLILSFLILIFKANGLVDNHGNKFEIQNQKLYKNDKILDITSDITPTYLMLYNDVLYIGISTTGDCTNDSECNFFLLYGLNTNNDNLEKLSTPLHVSLENDPTIIYVTNLIVKDNQIVVSATIGSKYFYNYSVPIN